MLNKAISVRVGDLWISWAKRLAGQSSRSTAEFIRDVIYLLVFDDELGQAVCQRLKSDQVSYSK